MIKSDNLAQSLSSPEQGTSTILKDNPELHSVIERGGFMNVTEESWVSDLMLHHITRDSPVSICYFKYKWNKVSVEEIQNFNSTSSELQSKNRAASRFHRRRYNKEFSTLIDSGYEMATGVIRIQDVLFQYTYWTPFNAALGWSFLLPRILIRNNSQLKKIKKISSELLERGLLL